MPAFARMTNFSVKNLYTKGQMVRKAGVATLPKSIVRHDSILSADFTFGKGLLTRCNAKGKSIALSGFKGYLPCLYARLRSMVMICSPHHRGLAGRGKDAAPQPARGIDLLAL
jgi:hypothetical protein